MEKHLIIAAGGRGERFGKKMPKQYVLLNGKPVIVHAIEAFLHAVENIKITIVAGADYLELLKKITEQFFPERNIIIVAGGNTRTESVKNGLAYVTAGTLVAIHDAARPKVAKSLINKGFILSKEKGSAIPVINITESLRKITPQKSKAVNREKYKIVQTPQFFQTDSIKKAYAAVKGVFSDDATVYEAAGFTPYLFPGDPQNIKITLPSDLEILKIIH